VGKGGGCSRSRFRSNKEDDPTAKTDDVFSDCDLAAVICCTDIFKSTPTTAKRNNVR